MKTFPTPRPPGLLRRGRFALGLVVSLLLPLTGAAIDPDLPFSSGSTGADGPLTFREIVLGGRTAAGMAYDAQRQRVVLFGGFSGGQTADTYLWNGNQWTRVLPAQSPPARWGHNMVYDSARGEVVLFGGQRDAGIRYNDTWTWNGTNWTLKTPANSPSSRYYATAAYDSLRQQVVLFGGSHDGDQTWVWNGTDWTQRNPVVRPPAHVNSAMAYDAARDRMVLFGNWGQTWLWDGTNWANANPVDPPAARNFGTMEYDPVRQLIVMVSGSNRRETYTWNGTNWTLRTPATEPPGRQYASMVWDGSLQRIFMFGGDVPGVDVATADNWLWDGTTWTYHSGKVQAFDMRDRGNGIWNFSSIVIPSGVTVRFHKNAANTPVRWLATEDVTINGVVDVSGQGGPGINALAPGVTPVGGPGGYNGGVKAIRFNSSTSFAGGPGQGPGGGLPGTDPSTSPQNLRDGQNGLHEGAYGNAFLQPLLGGSGGGGGSSTDVTDGGNGAGGGGAILISSSRDIILNGAIRANGGELEWSGASQGGRGSGGAILLKADRVSGPGTLEAYSGTPGNPVGRGRIRVEAFIRTLTSPGNPTAIAGLPGENGEINNAGATLMITNVEGVGVPNPPSGNLLTPDVVFSETGPVTVQIAATGVPNGTPVILRVATANGIITGTNNLAGGSTAINVTVPKGLGTLQATAQFAAP